MNHPNAIGMGCAELIDNIRCAVSGAIIHDDDLNRPMCLSQDTFYSFRQQKRPVINWYNSGNQWEIHGS
jgi:hypothetical protein